MSRIQFSLCTIGWTTDAHLKRLKEFGVLQERRKKGPKEGTKEERGKQKKKGRRADERRIT